MRAKFVLTSHLAPESGKRDVHCIGNRDCFGKQYIMNWYWLSNHKPFIFLTLFSKKKPTKQDPLHWENDNPYEAALQILNVCDWDYGRKSRKKVFRKFCRFWPFSKRKRGQKTSSFGPSSIKKACSNNIIITTTFLRKDELFLCS